MTYDQIIAVYADTVGASDKELQAFAHGMLAALLIEVDEVGICPAVVAGAAEIMLSYKHMFNGGKPHETRNRNQIICNH